MHDRNHDREAGAALITVAIGMVAIMSMVVLIFQLSASTHSQSQDQRRDDTVVAGAEAMLERYASKLTVDPSYFRLFVDEAEAPRRCSDISSPSFDQVGLPGDAWFDDCFTWTYDPATDYYEHPLLQGDPAKDSDNVGVLLQVTPPHPQTGQPLEVEIVGQLAERRYSRSITAEIQPDAISEFAWLVQNDLYFGPGVIVKGKIYVGEDLAFSYGPPQGRVQAHIYAHERIGCRWTGGTCSPNYGPPIFENGAQGWDSTGNYNDIDDPYPTPLVFSRFLDDLDRLKTAACDQGGLCLDKNANPSIPTGTDAYLIEPIVSGGIGQVRVSYAVNPPPGANCLNSTERWYVESQDAAWVILGTYNVPSNGAVWADEHVVIGRNSATPVTLKGAMTVYAGSASAKKNIIIGSDVLYNQGLTGIDVLGLAASDQVIINPNAVGPDLDLKIHAAMLIQDGAIHVSRSCGASGDAWGGDGSVVLPRPGGVPASELTTWGSIAMINTGDVSAHFRPRNYGFDTRLESLRPPLFPLLSDDWTYSNWRVKSLPPWAP